MASANLANAPSEDVRPDSADTSNSGEDIDEEMNDMNSDEQKGEWEGQKGEEEESEEEESEEEESEEEAPTFEIFLFYKPEGELPENPTPDDFRALGEHLKERLHRTANILEKLTAAGWSYEMALYSVMLEPPDFVSDPQEHLKRVLSPEEAEMVSVFEV